MLAASLSDRSRQSISINPRPPSRRGLPLCLALSSLADFTALCSILLSHAARAAANDDRRDTGKSRREDIGAEKWLRR